MMIVMILCLILSISAAAPLNSKAAEEDLVTDDIGSVNIMNGDYMDDDGIHSHSSQNTDRDARLVINAGDVSIGSISLSGDYARAKIAAVFSNVAYHDPHPALRTSQDRVPAHDPECEADQKISGSNCMCDDGICEEGSTCVKGKTCTPECDADQKISGSNCMCDDGICEEGSTCVGGKACTGGAVGVNKEDPAPIIEGISKQQTIKELIGTREKIQEWQCKLMDPLIKKIKSKSNQEEQLIQQMTKATSILQNHDYCRIENGNCEPKQMQTVNSIISKADKLVNDSINDYINGESPGLSHWFLKEFQERKKTFDEATVQEIQKLMPESSRVCIPGEISSAACVCRSASINSAQEEHCTANQGCTPHGFCFTVCNRKSCTCGNSANEGTENCANGQICINGKCLNVCQEIITSECICPDARGFNEYGGQQCPPNGEEGLDSWRQWLCGCSGCVLMITEVWDF